MFFASKLVIMCSFNWWLSLAYCLSEKVKILSQKSGGSLVRFLKKLNDFFLPPRKRNYSKFGCHENYYVFLICIIQ